MDKPMALWHTVQPCIISFFVIKSVTKSQQATAGAVFRGLSLWQSAAERAGAVDDVLRVGGADRLRDANCLSSMEP